MIRYLEEGMYLVSDLFMAPVLVLLVLLFAYSLFGLGQLFAQFYQRRQHRAAFNAFCAHTTPHAWEKAVPGYSLVCLWVGDKALNRDELDVAAFESLENVRMVSRLAPMLGLIATMIPMGPALKSLADGNVQGISENLIVAFSAVIFGLVIASITFWIASVKKRWLARELLVVGELIDGAGSERRERSNEAA